MSDHPHEPDDPRWMASHIASLDRDGWAALTHELLSLGWYLPDRVEVDRLKALADEKRKGEG